MPQRGVSPYATGGGGGGETLEQRVGVGYLALLLTGGGAPELGDGRKVVNVFFQRSPRVPLDDLVVLAARPDEPEPSLRLAIGVRRAPDLVPSDAKTRKLITAAVSTMRTAPQDGREHRQALVVAGHQDHARQLGELVALADVHMSASEYFDLVYTPQKFRNELVVRLGCLEDLVRESLKVLETPEPGADLVRTRTWELLTSLSVLMPRVEAPEFTDWSNTRNQLMTVARGQDLGGAGQLLERLETLAGRYRQAAATVDLTMLRRAVHPLLDVGETRTRRAWALLRELETQALEVKDRVGAADSDRALHLDRSSEEKAVVEAALGAAALVVQGESGVGKSSLVARAVRGAQSDPDAFEAVFLNLRQLPKTAPELIAGLHGCSMRTLLSELSAPNRLLVVDAADAVLEGGPEMFAYLTAAARDSGVRVIAVAAAECQQVVSDLLSTHLLGGCVPYTVSGLSEPQLDEIVVRFPELKRLHQDPRSRELLRRLVMVDLLVRSRVTDVPLSDLDAMSQVWAGLVRGVGEPNRGLPDARARVLLRLAATQLSGDDPLDAGDKLDAAAVNGLRVDGLLREAVENPWEILPVFAHDEIRRYAVAQVLLANRDPASSLRKAGAPRWALSAGMLACQAQLQLPIVAGSPARGRFNRLQAGFDTLVAEHGARWGDVPGEALLSLGEPEAVLAEAWPGLCGGDAAGLHRLLRLLRQRHTNTASLLEPAAAEPVVSLLLDEARPWEKSSEVAQILRAWLIALLVQHRPLGHPLRIRLRERLIEACAEGDERLIQDQQEATAARAARTAEAIAQGREYNGRQRFTNLGSTSRRRARRARPTLPKELSDDVVLETIALLGPDMGKAGEQLLLRVAREEPWQLAPALEETFSDLGVASFRRGLLADLTLAYYLDEEADGVGFDDEGIRHRGWTLRGYPISASFRGPFLILLKTDLRRGVKVVNQLLNHATLAPARRRLEQGDLWQELPEETDDEFKIELRVDGTPRLYAGGDSAWLWYRGSGNGPYPCMSALQALEQVCDGLIKDGVPLDRLLALLLEGCENLAMLGLVVGLLIRHIEQAGTLLDPVGLGITNLGLTCGSLVGRVRCGQAAI